jgi:hypothetical protein
VLNAAYQAHPERFVRSAPKLFAIPKEVWINCPASTISSGRRQLFLLINDNYS